MTTTSPDSDLPVRFVAGGAALLSLAVLAESGIEIYRGSFHDRAMVLPIATSSLGIAINGRRARLPEAAGGATGSVSHGVAAAVGLGGLGFHAYNIGKRVGGVSFTNLFYAAPVGAPAALVLAGVLGKAADALAAGEERIGPVSLGSGRAIGLVASIGILGTVGEAALLHFRGAFHDPFMWAPVTLPPIAALALLRDVAGDTPRRATAILLGGTALLGCVGVGFHIYGIGRNMGGWRNWRQNLLAGPPVPAPPAFTGLALAGLGALLMMQRRRARG
jgi:MYXO-CTERM domain-containing protein